MTALSLILEKWYRQTIHQEKEEEENLSLLRMAEMQKFEEDTKRGASKLQQKEKQIKIVLIS